MVAASDLLSPLLVGALRSGASDTFQGRLLQPSSTRDAAPHPERFIGPCVIIDKHARDTDPPSALEGDAGAGVCVREVRRERKREREGGRSEEAQEKERER